MFDSSSVRIFTRTICDTNALLIVHVLTRMHTVHERTSTYIYSIEVRAYVLCIVHIDCRRNYENDISSKNTHTRRARTTHNASYECVCAAPNGRTCRITLHENCVCVCWLLAVRCSHSCCCCCRLQAARLHQ